MKPEYDFSGATRGRFHTKDIEVELPVYLDPANMAFVEEIARRRKTDISSVVNDLIRSDREIAKALG